MSKIKETKQLTIGQQHSSQETIFQVKYDQ